MKVIRFGTKLFVCNVIGGILVLAIFAQPSSLGNHSVPRLSVEGLDLDRHIEFEETESTFLGMIGKLAIHHQVPIGAVLSSDSRSHPDRKIVISSGKLRDILDSLVEQEGGYAWETNGGVVNIVPISKFDSRLFKLLKIQVKEVAIEGEYSKFQIRDQILDLPEIKLFLNESKLEVLNRYYPYNLGKDGMPKVSLNIKGLDVQELLNIIVKDSKERIWILETIGESKEYLLLSF